MNDSGGVLQTKPGTDNSCHPLSLKDDNNEHLDSAGCFLLTSAERHGAEALVRGVEITLGLS